MSKTKSGLPQFEVSEAAWMMMPDEHRRVLTDHCAKLWNKAAEKASDSRVLYSMFCEDLIISQETGKPLYVEAVEKTRRTPAAD